MNKNKQKYFKRSMIMLILAFNFIIGITSPFIVNLSKILNHYKAYENFEGNLYYSFLYSFILIFFYFFIYFLCLSFLENEKETTQIKKGEKNNENKL